MELEGAGWNHRVSLLTCALSSDTLFCFGAQWGSEPSFHCSLVHSQWMHCNSVCNAGDAMRWFENIYGIAS